MNEKEVLAHRASDFILKQPNEKEPSPKVFFNKVHREYEF